ncbi:MAG: Glu/Leu/Phe/Val dehydrogenase family protein [Dehalococcoidia bacterium]|nr:Glu/Leu/Phe/Val dehydrogenase family protein [Dehalococcoidia bacterium]
MSDSVFALMEKEDLTTLEIFHNRKEGKFILRGMKEWDDSIPWDRYMVDFTAEDILTEDYKAVGTATLLARFNELGLKEYLSTIEQLLREGKHHGIEFYYNSKKNIRVMYCKHVNTLGIRNRRHAMRAGAMRRHELSELEIDVIVDGLNIARAMAYKNAIANIPYGGSKILVQCNAVELDDFETMGFLAYISDRSRSFTGPDMNFEPEMADIIREKFTKNYTDGRKSSMGTSGAPTGYGEYIAIKEACDFIYGNRDLSKRKIAIQGLGEVGYPLAEYLLNDSAPLIVTDIDLSKVHKLQQKYGLDLVQYVEPEDIYTVDTDIFSPCAMGGIITEERIDEFKFDIIIGSANNQLKATSKEAEIELAKKLADAGILFVVDWAHNAGGVLTAWAEWLFQEEASFDKIKPRIELVCRDNLRKLLEEAKRTGKTPTELVYDKVEDMLYSDVGFSETL